MIWQVASHTASGLREQGGRCHVFTDGCGSHKAVPSAMLGTQGTQASLSMQVRTMQQVNSRRQGSLGAAWSWRSYLSWIGLNDNVLKALISGPGRN